MATTKSSFVRVYLTAAEKGDIHSLETALNNATEFDDINVRDAKGRTALELAIENGRLDVIQVLLQHGVELGDSMLQAVDTKFFKAVQILLELPQADDLVNSHASENNDDFHPDITPIILAAHQNDYDTIKLLMEKGAPEIKLSDFHTEKHTVQRSVGTLNIYKALASEAYISYSELEKRQRPDPFGRAFELSVELRELSSTEYEFRQAYSELAEQCEQFAADLLGQTRDADELRAVLNHNSNPSVAEQKQFVAHPYCQQELIERWYRGLPDWRDQGSIRNFLLSTLIMVFYPILCLLYIVLPVGKFRRFMRVPYVKFLLHTSSYVYFMFILIMTTQDLRSYDENSALGKLAMRQVHYQQRGPLPNAFEFLLIIWVAGMVWKEIKEVWSVGFREYFSDTWNYFDFVQLSLYLSWMGLRTAAFVLVDQERDDALSDVSRTDVNPTASALLDVTEESISRALETAFQAVSPTSEAIKNSTEAILEQISPMIQSDQEILANLTRMLTTLTQLVSERLPAEEPESVIDYSQYVNQSRFDDVSYSVPRSEWAGNDPSLIADCVIALANVISIVRFLRTMVINEYVGPLQISFSKMIKDIVQFLFIFVIIWIAFGLGLTQLYWLYAATDKLACLQGGGSNHECSQQAFGDIASSLESLFWSLYGLVDLDVLQVEADHGSTEFFGKILFGGYNVIAVIILLNLLIALMGTTYTNISEHSDMEWKFSRSEMWMDYFRHGATMPPPFNIVPTPKSLVRVTQHLINHVFCRKCSKKVKWVTSRKTKVNDDSYKEVCKQLVMRYFAEKASVARDSGEGGAAKEDLIAIKQDLSAIRYELYGLEQQVKKEAVNSNKRSDVLSDGIKGVVTEIGRNKLQDNELLKESRNELMGSSEKGNTMLQLLEKSLTRMEDEQREWEEKRLKTMTDWFTNLQSDVLTSKEEETGLMREMQGDLTVKDEQKKNMLTSLNDQMVVVQRLIAEQERNRLEMVDNMQALTKAVKNLSGADEPGEDKPESLEAWKA
ncbi:short transient receptor potential channel 4-like [Ptychodera flava]|uniref:short transient receptor potential channel 4-like n=1 Tax=Ptychodera flava TaxID=63121 RepID=UPI00396A17B1